MCTTSRWRRISPTRTPYWRRLDDLEYLQGFADRAYQRLVQSGDYGYRSLARLLEATIEQQYPLRIDPRWITFRSQTGPWRPPKLPAGKEHSKLWLALAERPTDLPLEHWELSERLAKVGSPRYMLD